MAHLTSCPTPGDPRRSRSDEARAASRATPHARRGEAGLDLDLGARHTQARALLDLSSPKLPTAHGIPRESVGAPQHESTALGAAYPSASARSHPSRFSST